MRGCWRRTRTSPRVLLPIGIAIASWSLRAGPVSLSVYLFRVQRLKRGKTKHQHVLFWGACAAPALAPLARALAHTLHYRDAVVSVFLVCVRSMVMLQV